jgi:ribonuclease-3
MALRNPLVAPVHGDHLTDSERLARAEAVLGHHFARPQLLQEALTHRSASQGVGRRGRVMASNERLEFVGDRVLGLLVAEWLIERFPREQEGELGRRLAQLVSQPVLAAIAETLGLSAVLSVAPGESRAGVRKRATVLADGVEAVLGAIFLDAGLDAARRFVRHAWDAAMTAQAEPPKDAKTALQEWAQARGFELPTYQLVSREGPPHAPVFVMGVTVTDKAGSGETGTGTASTKQAAEQLAAAALLATLAPRSGAGPSAARECSATMVHPA